jgi:hypothetical protein
MASSEAHTAYLSQRSIQAIATLAETHPHAELTRFLEHTKSDKVLTAEFADALVHTLSELLLEPAHTVAVASTARVLLEELFYHAFETLRGKSNGSPHSSGDTSLQSIARALSVVLESVPHLHSSAVRWVLALTPVAREIRCPVVAQCVCACVCVEVQASVHIFVPMCYLFECIILS